MLLLCVGVEEAQEEGETNGEEVEEEEGAAQEEGAGG